MAAPVSRPLGWLVFACRVVLGAAFVLAGVLKLQEPQRLAEAIDAFKVIPKSGEHLVLLAAFAIPWAEIIAGVFLLIGLWARSAALLLTIMLLVFIAMIASVLIRIEMGEKLSASCTCFGKLDWPCLPKLGWCQITRDVVMIGLALPVLIWGPGPCAIDREPPK
jgi:uncharacterized membrane protein YphA (DoxX/SURF4 family)